MGYNPLTPIIQEYKAGNIDGAEMLASILGEQVPRDPVLAQNYFTQSANQGNQFAQYSLGKLLLTGDEGVPRDVNAAVDWFTRAANQGNSFAQYQLGRLFWMGKDVPQDRQKAWDYLVRRSG